MLKVPEKMYGKRDTSKAPKKSYQTSGKQAYGDSGIDMLETPPKKDKFGFEIYEPQRDFENERPGIDTVRNGK